MNFLDAYIDEKIRKLYLQIIRIDDGNRKFVNQTIEYSNLRDKVRIFKVVIDVKAKHQMDFSDDEQRLKDLITKIQQIKNAKRY
jgi:ribosomal protein L5